MQKPLSIFKKVLLLLVAAICIFCLNPRTSDNVSYHNYDFFSGQIGDFAHAYASGWLLRKGENPYGQDLVPIYEKLSISTRNQIKSATNPPSLILVQLPFTYLSPINSFYLWSTFKACIFIFCLISLCRITALQGVLSYLIAFSLFLSTPVLMDFYEGQINIFLLFLFILGLLLQNKDIPGGSFCWGVMSSLKFFTLPLIILSFLKSGRKGFYGFIAGLLTPFILFCVFFDSQIAFDYFTSVLSDTYNNYSLRIINRNFANTLVFLHSLLMNAKGIRIETFNLFSSILLYTFVFSVFCYGIFMHLKRKAINLNRDSSILICLCVMFSPIAWEHYYVLFIPLIVFTYPNYLKSGAKGLLFICAYSIFLLSNKILFFYQSSQLKAFLYFYVLSGILLIAILTTAALQSDKDFSYEKFD